nr:DUF2336 domain-containing protein [Burkholderiales bacterium]
MQRARECLDEIVQLYQDGPSGRANELLERIADLYFLTLEQQSADERGSFGDAMLRMSQSADPIARARFAERIAKAAPVPVELLLYLAREEICVARPILQYSPCLREGDLVSIITDVGQDHLGATALRPNLTVPVTDLLVQRGEPRVLVALAQNVAADLSASSVDRLYTLANEEDELME